MNFAACMQIQEKQEIMIELGDDRVHLKFPVICEEQHQHLHILSFSAVTEDRKKKVIHWLNLRSCLRQYITTMCSISDVTKTEDSLQKLLSDYFKVKMQKINNIITKATSCSI